MARLAVSVPVLCVVLLALVRGAAGPAVPDFDRDIAPLLTRKCLDCHSGSSPKGDLDLSRRKKALATVVAGKPDESYLWQRIRDDEMPPKKPLSASEKALLRRWIASGARWGSDPIDPFRTSNDHRAGYDWWSLRPLMISSPPPVIDSLWPRNPIDRFVLARLQASKLAPSPEADRRTLLRRLSFDLTGLPPTPDEGSAFLADTRPDAYERLVDRLLASPAYGERWARHWLDVVRFGESDGFERDLPRFNAWPYRDWVLGALNHDLPYDEFVRLQLAGDVLGGDNDLAATGFLVAGPHDIVLPVSETMKATMRQEELEDLVGTVGQTFLGLTVHCARCHDHKFDPVPQKDYYRLVAALGGVRHGERTTASEAKQIRLVQRQRDADRLRKEIDTLEEPIRRVLLAEKQKMLPRGPKPLAAWDFRVDLGDEKGALPVRFHGKARQTSAGLVLDGRTAYASAGPLKKDLTAKTLEAWVQLGNLDQRGGGVLGVQTSDGHSFDAIVYGEQEPNRWMAGSEFFNRTRSFEGTSEKENKKIVHIAIVYQTDGSITAYRDGRVYGKPYQVKEPRTFRAGQAQVVFGLRHGTPGGNRLLAGTIVKARLYDRALNADEVARSAGLPTIRVEEILPRLSAEVRDRYRRLRADWVLAVNEVEQLRREIAQRIYAVNSQPIGPTRVLLRGNVTSPGEPVEPTVLTALASQVPTVPKKTPSAEAQRRVELARWISDVRNPLFARVIVNRVWHHHFGVGLVDTPSDLGFNGGRPSHPELLDWLASELIRQGWSLKRLHRTIVLSATYRQSSRPRAEALKVDADNRLLWRKSPQRLEAESVRDAILTSTGQLDRTMGGPPYLDFRTYFFKGTQFYDVLEQTGPEFSRRSLYRMWARGGRSPFLDTFDCPDPSATTPRRAVTTTPLQALTLFNNAFVLTQSDRFAERLRNEAADRTGQVRRAYLLTFGREPEKREQELVERFVERHGLEALGRVLFNTNEFVQID